MCNYYINKFEYTCGISEMYSRYVRAGSQQTGRVSAYHPKTVEG